MEVKSLGGGKSFARTVNYLGTAGDKTPAHINKGIKGYKLAKKYHEKNFMNYFAPYLHRDLMTFGPMRCGSKRQLEASEKKIMNGTHRKVKSREFVLMPSKKDEIDPHDPDSILRFKDYISKWVDSSFNGYWKPMKKRKGKKWVNVKTKKGNQKYKFIHTKDPKFTWFADIQPDSHNNGKVHAHIVVINRNLDDGKAMSSNYYNIYHLRRSARAVSKATGFSLPTQKMKVHEPSKVEKKIIESARKIKHNPDITSRPKFIKALAKNGVTAHFRRNKKHPSRNGWKFKIPKHSYIKASRLSHAVGGAFLATDSIGTILSDNRKLKSKNKAKARHRAEVKANNKRLDELARQHQQLIKRQREAEFQRKKKIKDSRIKKAKQREARQRANQRRLNAINQKAEAKKKRQYDLARQRQQEAEIKRERHERKIQHEKKIKYERHHERLQSAKARENRQLVQSLAKQQHYAIKNLQAGKQLIDNVQDGNKELTKSTNQRQRNFEAFKGSAGVSEKYKKHSKPPVSRFKDRISERVRRIGNRIKSRVGSIFDKIYQKITGKPFGSKKKHTEHAPKRTPRATKRPEKKPISQDWLKYRKSSINATKRVARISKREANEVPKFPPRPRPVHNNIKKIQEIKKAKRAKKRRAKAIDNKILKLAKKFKRERESEDDDLEP